MRIAYRTEEALGELAASDSRPILFFPYYNRIPILNTGTNTCTVHFYLKKPFLIEKHASNNRHKHVWCYDREIHTWTKYIYFSFPIYEFKTHILLYVPPALT